MVHWWIREFENYNIYRWDCEVGEEWNLPAQNCYSLCCPGIPLSSVREASERTNERTKVDSDELWERAALRRRASQDRINGQICRYCKCSCCTAEPSESEASFCVCVVIAHPNWLASFQKKKIVYGERPIGSLEKFYSYIQHHTALGQVYSGSVL